MRLEQIALPLVCSACLVTGAGAVVPLVATPAAETSPSGNGVDLAWTRGSVDRPVVVMKLGAVFVRHRGGSARRITPRGTLAASGGMDARTLVVQVVRDRNSDLRLYDLRTRRFRPLRSTTSSWWVGPV